MGVASETLETNVNVQGRHQKFDGNKIRNLELWHHLNNGTPVNLNRVRRYPTAGRVNLFERLQKGRWSKNDQLFNVDRKATNYDHRSHRLVLLSTSPQQK